MSALQSLNNLLSKIKQDDIKQEDDEKELILRITPEILSKCIDLREYRNRSKYPYIKVLPTTKPSKEFIRFDNELWKSKQDFLNAYKNSSNPLFTTSDELMELFKPIFLNNKIRNPSDCECRQYKEIPNIKCYWIKYKGASIQNGVCLVFHGAAYVIDYANWCFAECELLSKLTGMICIAVQYKKAPKYPLPTPINDAIQVYNHFLNELKISSSNIVFVGDSSGGGLTLLTLQHLAQNKIELPSCAILQAPWCYLNYDAKDVNSIDELDKKRQNYKYDSNLNYPAINIMAKMALGLMDNNLKPVRNKLVKIMDDQSIYNPICNDFTKLKDVSMYFMVGATEAILYDTLDCAKKAYNDGCRNIRVDIEPYMFHSWPVFCGHFPEGQSTIAKMADFILQNVTNFEDIPKSKYEPDSGQIISV